MLTILAILVWGRKSQKIEKLGKNLQNNKHERGKGKQMC
jgi:hypothetical protein